MDKKQLLSEESDSSSDSDSLSDSDPETTKEIERDSPDLNDVEMTLERSKNTVKRRAPIKTTHPLSTTEEDTSGGSAGTAPTPPEKRTKTAPKNIHGKQTLQLTQGRERIETTKSAEQSPQEASLREQMGLAQRVFLQAIAAVGAPMEAHHRDALVDSFQAVTNVATQLLEENAFLRGRLVERPHTNEHTHTSYASILKKDLSNSGVRNTEEQTELPNAVKTPRNENPTPKAALLIYPTKPKKNEEHRQVVQVLRSAFTPTDIGLEAPEVRRIKGGALVLSKSSEGITNLEKAINNKPELKANLETKRPYRRNPQLKIRGVSSSLNANELKAAILRQNSIESTPEEITIIKTFPNQYGTQTVVVEVSPSLFQQLGGREKLLIDWSSCPVEENLHILFCRRCCTYGHGAERCSARPRCTECGSEHRGTECTKSGERRCLACEERLRPHEGDERPTHSALDPACPTYLWHIERLKQKINYF